MRGLDDVRRLFYGAQDYDRVAVRLGFEYEPELIQVVRHRPVKSDVGWDVANLTAEIAGIAVVLSPEGLFGIGTKTSLGFWEWGKYQPYKIARAEALDSLEQPHMTAVQAFRAKRISANRVAHTVANHYPELRIWPGEAGYDPAQEIQLRARAGSLRLGGIIKGA